MIPVKLAALVVGIIVMPGCVQGLLGYAGVFDGAVGSCTYPETNGYVVCEDFLGSDASKQLVESLCVNGETNGRSPDTRAAGTWSGDSCPGEGALGTCFVEPEGTGSAQTYQYTYTASKDPDTGVTATVLTAETACGVAGGTFAAAK